MVIIRLSLVIKKVFLRNWLVLNSKNCISLLLLVFGVIKLEKTDYFFICGVKQELTIEWRDRIALIGDIEACLHLCPDKSITGDVNSCPHWDKLKAR